MAPDMTDPSELPTLDAHTQSMEMIAETLALYSTIQSLDGPRAKDYISDLIIPEDYVASGLNFGSIYSELVHQKDYPNYTFVAGDFEALDVTIDSNDTYSLDDAGVTVSPDGDITIDTNKNVYQPFNDGDLINTSIAFRVTDNNNLSDIGSVELVVAGKDERISDGWQGGKELINDVVGDLLGQYATGDAISTILDTQGNKSNISFDFYSVGSWDSENFVVKTDNDIIFEQDFQASNPFSGSREGVTTIDGKAFQWSIESNGRDHYGLGRFTQNASVEVDMPSGLQNITLTLTSDVDGGVNDESWAVNNFNFNIPPSISLDQRHTDVSGGDFLKLGYALKGNDDTGNPGGNASDLGVDSSGLTNVAVLGPNTSDNKTYTLEISAESLKADWDLESADIVLKYDTQLFKTIDADDITLGDHLTLEKGIVVDDDNGLIRIAAASLSNNAFNNGDSIDSEAIFASINVDFDETYFKSSDRTPDANGKFTFEGNPLGFELSANSDETVFSRTFNSDADGKEIAGGAFTNREIQSLGDLKGDTTFDPGDVNLYQAEIKFEEQVGGLTFGTDRVIGANQGFTNLIRRGDTVTAETTIENIGNSLAKDILIEDAGLVKHASFVTSRFLEKISGDDEIDIADGEKVNLSGGVFRDDFSYNADGQESLNIEVDMAVTGQAGSVVDVTKGLFKVSAAGMTQNPETEATPDFFVSSAGSKNLITFQGDLNYDGRVSMKDLAFLNAGAARQQLVDSTDDDGNLIQVASDDSYARDVDADFSGKIDLADLSVLDQDWGQSLHDGTSGGFTGSSNTFTLQDLDTQGAETWDNDSFKNQNAIEAEDAYIGSLETTVAAGDIGADSGNNTDPMTGEELNQEG